MGRIPASARWKRDVKTEMVSKYARKQGQKGIALQGPLQFLKKWSCNMIIIEIIIITTIIIKTFI